MTTMCKEVGVHTDKKANFDCVLKEEEYSVLLNGNYNLKRYKIGKTLDIIIATAKSRNLQSFAIYTKPKNKFFGEKYIGTIVRNEKDYNKETLLIKGGSNHWMQLHSYE